MAAGTHAAGVTGIDHVQIAAPTGCEDDARRFFGELLGLSEAVKPEPLRTRGGVWFDLGSGQQLHVGVEAEFAPARKAHPALRVTPTRLDALADRLCRGGARVSWDDALPGVRRFYTEDPWGNRLELIAADDGRGAGVTSGKPAVGGVRPAPPPPAGSR